MSGWANARVDTRAVEGQTIRRCPGASCYPLVSTKNTRVEVGRATVQNIHQGPSELHTRMRCEMVSVDPPNHATSSCHGRRMRWIRAGVTRVERREGSYGCLTVPSNFRTWNVSVSRFVVQTPGRLGPEDIGLTWNGIASMFTLSLTRRRFI